MSSNGNIPKDLTGIAFWKRSCTGRTRSLWVYVMVAYHREYDGKECWLVRELIRGGVGPMHGKALRDVVVPEYVWNRRELLGESEYTKEIYELISEAMLNELGGQPLPGAWSHWELRENTKKRLKPQIDYLYHSHGINPKHPNMYSRKNFQVDTNAGHELRLYVGFDTEQEAISFIKQSFAMNLAQSAKLHNVTANTTRKFRKRKKMNEKLEH